MEEKQHEQKNRGVGGEMLTPEQVAEIRKREAAATPGPWKYHLREDDEAYPASIFSIESDALRSVAISPRFAVEHFIEADAPFIASARTDVPALCDTVDALRAEVERLNQKLTGEAEFSSTSGNNKSVIIGACGSADPLELTPLIGGTITRIENGEFDLSIHVTDVSGVSRILIARGSTYDGCSLSVDVSQVTE